MKQSPSWEANRSAASQEIPHILWNAEGSLPHSKVPATVPILSQLDPTFWRSILTLSSHLRLGLQSGLTLSSYLTENTASPYEDQLPNAVVSSNHFLLYASYEAHKHTAEGLNITARSANSKQRALESLHKEVKTC